jgi:hypothetical protein
VERGRELLLKRISIELALLRLRHIMEDAWGAKFSVLPGTGETDPQSFRDLGHHPSECGRHRAPTHCAAAAVRKSATSWANE